MSEATIPVILILSWVFISLIVGVLAGIKRKFSLEGYLVSGRSLGLIFLYVLMAGEIYSAYAFLGTGGWAYSYGMPIMYAIGYGALAYSFGYFYARYVWKIGKAFKCVTEADYFETRYDSKALALLVALIGIIFNVPYLQLQLQGLGYIIHVGSLGAISLKAGIIIGMAIMLIYVYTSGLRGIAWTNFLQALLMFIVAWAVLFAIPFIQFGGIGEMFTALEKVKPGHLVLHPPLGIPWYVSTLILSGLGFFMYPQLYPSIYSARDLKTLKRNYVLLPLYSIFMIPVILAGFTVAALGVQLGRPDEAVLKAVELSYPSWVLGIVGAAGFAAAASTASAIILSLAGLLSKNIYTIVKPSASDRELVLVSRISVILFGLTAMILALYAPGRLVALLLLAYSGMTQLFPGAVLGIFWKRMNKYATGAGIIAGLITITYLKFGLKTNPLGIHFGLWGLMVNFVVTIIVAYLTKPDPNFEKFRAALS
ncbi:sodium:solute symporter family protein [Pyrococcus kukulkanii]|uniref:Sodium:solute symporter family protein n=1 Tax=Pyrococcus kukulkanii TaxID=1609559 RepID=A0ABV4T5D9_9EURY